MFPRKVTLLNLNRDLMSFVLKDWVCKKCGYENRYSGGCHGIYPAAKHRAFVVELLNFWMQKCIGRGTSFRTIFELPIICITQLALVNDMRRIDVLLSEFKRDRHLANDALRYFCENVDLSDLPKWTKDIFSCAKCELELSKSDCKKLGLTGEGTEGKKLFQALSA